MHSRIARSASHPEQENKREEQDHLNSEEMVFDRLNINTLARYSQQRRNGESPLNLIKTVYENPQKWSEAEYSPPRNMNKTRMPTLTTPL